MKSKGLTPEEITAQPRAERKLDRVKEIAAAAEAETTFKEESRVIAPGIAPDGTRITTLCCDLETKIRIRTPETVVSRPRTR